MRKKLVWRLSITGAAAILVTLAVYSVNNYNAQLEAGSNIAAGPAAEEQNDSQTVGEASGDENQNSEASAEVAAEVSLEVSAEAEEPARELAPDFTLKDLQGNDVSIKDFRGKKVFLTFWATWCPYCKKQMPLLQELEEENREDLVILTVATADSLSLEKHMKDNGFTLMVVRDYSKTLEKIQFKYKAMTIPGNFLIDEEGYIVAKRNSFSTREVMDKFLSKFDES
jgi:thiol-disulfide isomerase/thioredoxin